MAEDFAAFGEAELKGWSNPSTAAKYVELFARASDQTVPALLEACGAAQGRKVLDLCCGQGNVTAQLVERGCETVGLDFSPTMLEIARERAPAATLIEGDAQDLPFDDDAFDAVASNFGVIHVPDQPRTLSEIHRVLKPGGRFAMTTWCGPDVSDAFRTFYGAVQAHGSPEVTIPPGPDFHQFANQETAEQILSAAGFRDIETTTVPCAWRLDEPGGLFDIYRQATVRAALLLANQPPENLAAIQEQMAETVRKNYADGDAWRVPVPAALCSATK